MRLLTPNGRVETLKVAVFEIGVLEIDLGGSGWEGRPRREKLLGTILSGVMIMLIDEETLITCTPWVT